MAVSLGSKKLQDVLLVLVVCVATFMLLLDLTVINVALPSIQRDTGASFRDLQWTIDAYSLGLAVALVGAGKVADRWGKMPVFALGLVIFTVASWACGLAGSIDQLNLSRGVQGLGGAILFAVGPALLSERFTGPARAKAIAALGAAAGLAIAVGPLVGGAATEHFSWRWIFYLNIPLGALGLCAAFAQSDRRGRPNPAMRIDFVGLVLFTAACSAAVLGFIDAGHLGWGAGRTIGLLGGAAVLAVVLLVQQRRARHPLFEPDLFANRTFNGLNIATFMCGVGTMAALFLLVSYVQNVLGHSAWETGLRFLPLTLSVFVFAAVTGAIRRLPPRLTVSVSIALIGAGLLAVPLTVDAQSGWTDLLLATILVGAGMGMFNPPRAFLSVSTAEPARAGLTSAINETAQNVGIALGVAALGSFFETRLHDAAPTGPVEFRAAYVDALNSTMYIAGALCLIGAVCAWALIRDLAAHEDTRQIEKAGIR